jgi:hypothetical protein
MLSGTGAYLSVSLPSCMTGYWIRQSKLKDILVKKPATTFKELVTQEHETAFKKFGLFNKHTTICETFVPKRGKRVPDAA